MLYRCSWCRSRSSFWFRSLSVSIALNPSFTTERTHVTNGFASKWSRFKSCKIVNTFTGSTSLDSFGKLAWLDSLSRRTSSNGIWIVWTNGIPIATKGPRTFRSADKRAKRKPLILQQCSPYSYQPRANRSGIKGFSYERRLIRYLHLSRSTSQNENANKFWFNIQNGTLTPRLESKSPTIAAS